MIRFFAGPLGRLVGVVGQLSPCIATAFAMLEKSFLVVVYLSRCHLSEKDLINRRCKKHRRRGSGCTTNSDLYLCTSKGISRQAPQLLPRSQYALKSRICVWCRDLAFLETCTWKLSHNLSNETLFNSLNWYTKSRQDVKLENSNVDCVIATLRRLFSRLCGSIELHV